MGTRIASMVATGGAKQSELRRFSQDCNTSSKKLQLKPGTKKDEGAAQFGSVQTAVAKRVAKVAQAEQIREKHKRKAVALAEAFKLEKHKSDIAAKKAAAEAARIEKDGKRAVA